MTTAETVIDAERVFDDSVDSGELELLLNLAADNGGINRYNVDEIVAEVAAYRAQKLGIVMSNAEGLDTLYSGSLIVDADGRLNIGEYYWGGGLKWSRSDSPDFFYSSEVRVPATVVLIDPDPAEEPFNFDDI